MTTQTAIPLITISGPQGCGKTHIANSIIRHFAVKAGWSEAQARIAEESLVYDGVGKVVFKDAEILIRTEQTDVEEQPTSPVAVMPPYGPLTSTEHLLPGDLVRVIKHTVGDAEIGNIATVRQHKGGRILLTDLAGWNDQPRFAFIGRPDADGWIDAPEGGYPENPVPGRMVNWITNVLPHDSMGHVTRSEDIPWTRKNPECVVTRWRLLPEETPGEIAETSFEDEDNATWRQVMSAVNKERAVREVAEAAFVAAIIPAEERLAADIRAAAQVFDALLAQAEQTGIRVTIRQGEGAFRLGSPDVVKVL